MPRITRRNLSKRMVQAARENRCQLTAAEARLWQALRNRQRAGLKFRKQHPLGPYVLDFYCLEEKLAIEVDGSIHDHPEQQRMDEARTQWLEEQGIRVLRFSNDWILGQLPLVLDQIQEFVWPHPLRAAKID